MKKELPGGRPEGADGKMLRSIIMLLRDNAVIEAGILRCSRMQTEVKVEAGERIGEWRADP